ncbi:MAG: hypothetical protein C4583_04985 [Anaerolineaceae bacterium]|nr:MAG: hypothetical protein C4583_04985 [Anaerolineaceae bacterium]
MARPSSRDSLIRATLETIILELVTINQRMPVIGLRVSQARERTGLAGLLSPALEEIDDVDECVSTISEQVTAALALLKE